MTTFLRNSAGAPVEVPAIWEMTRSLGAALSLLVMVGCSSAPRELLAVEADQTRVQANTLAGVHVVVLADKRVKNAVLVDISGQEMAGQDVMLWLRNSLLLAGGSVADPEGAVVGALTDSITAGEEHCRVELDLLRAEVRPVATSLTSSIVLGIRRERSTEETRVLRGSLSRMNWNSATGETNNALRDALAEAIEQIPEFCGAPV